jgi:tetratricopeptide (TPR) repeat protein/predicted aspartyl protease
MVYEDRRDPEIDQTGRANGACVMKYSGLSSSEIRLPHGLKRVFGTAVILILLLSASTAIANVPSTANTDEIDKLIKQATKLARGGDLAGAENMLRRAAEMDPLRTEAKVELAYILTKQRKLTDAYNMVFPVAEADRKNSRAFAVLGMVLLTAGRFNEARAVFITAVNMNRKEDLAVAGYGLLEFYENHIDDSLLNLREAVFLNPRDPDYCFALAQVAARAEGYQEAAENYERFVRESNLSDVDRRARIKGLINFLKYLGQREGLYLPSGNDQTKIHFDLVGNRPIINLKVNGRKEPLKFVLDTGSGISVISEDTAKRMRISSVTRGGYAKGIGGDGRFEIVYGFLREVSMGDVSVRNVPIYIRKFQNENQDVDGYVGLSLISKFLTTIDYGDQSFSLTRREIDTREFRGNSPLSMPLRLTSSGFLSGEVQLEGVELPLNFIVDTGASVSVISDRVAKLSAVSQFVSEEKLRVVGSAGVTGDVPTFLLPSVTFGSHTRKSIVAVALDLDIINEASGFEQAGILGGNFLKNYRLTFDFRNAKVTFTSIVPDN